MGALKILAAFAAGIGCGVFATKAYFEKHYKEIADSEIESVVENFRKKEEKQKKEEEDKKMYTEIADDYISSVPPDKLVERVAKQAHPEDDEPDEPYQITSMDFFNDGGYDKVNLTYFVDDEALVGPSDDKDEDILDIGSTIGTDAVDILETGFNDGSAMYIRNPKMGTDYEVSKTYASFKGLMLDD